MSAEEAPPADEGTPEGLPADEEPEEVLTPRSARKKRLLAKLRVTDGMINYFAEQADVEQTRRSDASARTAGISSPRSKNTSRLWTFPSRMVRKSPWRDTKSGARGVVGTTWNPGRPRAESGWTGKARR